jgi:AcrR family transcriptional regulator
MEATADTRTRRRVAHRTQQERREETIGKLLDATIDSLADVGYAHTSVSEICSRAGVSHGALFCHFDSRLELIAAAADEVGRRHLARLRAEFEPVENTIAEDADTLARVVRFLDAAAHSRMNAVWHELLVAARTDEGLRPAVRRVMGRYAGQIEAAAAELFGADDYDPVRFRSAIWGLVCLFDGMALSDCLDLGDSHPRSDIVRSAPEIARLVLNAVAGGTATSPKARRKTTRVTQAAVSAKPGKSGRNVAGKGRGTKGERTSQR